MNLHHLRIAVTSALILAGPGLAAAQTTTTEQPTTTTAPVTPIDRDDDFDWGWVGLLGLAGLAGLMRREPVVRHVDPNTTRTSSTVR